MDIIKFTPRTSAQNFEQRATTGSNTGSGTAGAIDSYGPAGTVRPTEMHTAELGTIEPPEFLTVVERFDVDNDGTLNADEQQAAENMYDVLMLLGGDFSALHDFVEAQGYDPNGQHTLADTEAILAAAEAEYGTE